MGQGAPHSPLFLPAAITLALWVIFGGSAPEGILQFAVLALSGSAMLAMLTLWGGLASWRSLSLPARLMLLFFCMVPLVQLVPLPPALWQALPGRTLSTQTLAAAGVAGDWHPLTLAVAPTFRTLLVFVWLASLLLALLQLSSDELRLMFGVLLALGLLNLAVGVIQVVSGHAALGFYNGVVFLGGLFANKNHTGLFIALTFLAGYAALYGKQGWNSRNLALVISVGLVLFIALIATFSRAGVLFGLMAIAFLVVLSSGNRPRVRDRLLYILGAIVAVGIVLAVIASTDMASRALERFGGVSTDLRWSIWQWSWPLVGLYFPAGSGIGSFTAVFPPHEQLAWVKPTYVNHAHNDYLEQLIETGIAAPVGWALVLAAVWGSIGTAWRERSRQSGRLATIGAAMLFLIAVHSSFDYPLRRPAIAATAMVALAAVLRMGNKSRLRATTGYARHASVNG